MELYEIVKIDILDHSQSCYIGKTTVITATMDKAMAEQMLSIYKQNCGTREGYEIRTIKGE
jgi:hypothetical protein